MQAKQTMIFLASPLFSFAYITLVNQATKMSPETSNEVESAKGSGYREGKIEVMNAIDIEGPLNWITHSTFLFDLSTWQVCISSRVCKSNIS